MNGKEAVSTSGNCMQFNEELFKCKIQKGGHEDEFAKKKKKQGVEQKFIKKRAHNTVEDTL